MENFVKINKGVYLRPDSTYKEEFLNSMEKSMKRVD